MISKHVGDDPLSCTGVFTEPEMDWGQFGFMNLNAGGLASTDGQYLLIHGGDFPLGSLNSKARRGL